MARLAWPGMLTRSGQVNLGISAFSTLNDEGYYQAYIMPAPFDLEINFAGCSIATVSGGGECEIRIETVGGDGVPTGTLWDTGTSAASGALTSNSFPWLELTAPAIIPMGEVFAVKVLRTAGSFQTTRMASFHSEHSAFPCLMRNLGDGPTVTNWDEETVALGKSATECYPLPECWPGKDIITRTFSDSSGTVWSGNQIVLPRNLAINGMRRLVTNHTGDVALKVFDLVGTELATGAHPGAVRGDSSSRFQELFFDAPFAGSKGDVIRLVVGATTATTSADSAALLPEPFFRQAWYGDAVRRVTYDGDDWTVADDEITLLDLLASDIGAP